MTSQRTPRRTASRAHWRVIGMARALGINIAYALRTRRLSRDDYGDMVHCCAECGWSDACALWTRGEGQGARAAPAICGNRDAFLRLKQSA